MTNKRYYITCSECKTTLHENEEYDFRVHMYKSEGHGIFAFIDDHIDTSGMECPNECKNAMTEITEVKQR
jgi:hypothetical protein